MVKSATAVADFFQFFRSYVSNPGQVSAIAPSGQSLARLMTQEIVPGSGPVIELGPGTGIFTKALIQRGVPERDLLLIEYGSDFMRLLQQRFPRAKVLWMDARQLSQYGLFMAPAAAVVSGLPLLSMSPRKVMAILTGAFQHMREGGTFYQFTYGPRCPVPRPILDRLGLKANLVGRTAFNIPPASVYRIRRRADVSQKSAMKDKRRLRLPSAAEPN
jgi:phospholipid N-methyltransferase